MFSKSTVRQLKSVDLIPGSLGTFTYGSQIHSSVLYWSPVAGKSNSVDSEATVGDG